MHVARELLSCGPVAHRGQQSLADLNTAYRNFLASVAGKRKGPKVAPPRFRSRKDSRQAIRFTANARFAVTQAGKLRLPKVGDVPVRWSRRLPSVPSSVTMILDAAGGEETPSRTAIAIA